MREVAQLSPSNRRGLAKAPRLKHLTTHRWLVLSQGPSGDELGLANLTRATRRGSGVLRIFLGRRIQAALPCDKRFWIGNRMYRICLAAHLRYWGIYR
jgi:hypothetical protein